MGWLVFGAIILCAGIGAIIWGRTTRDERGRPAPSSLGVGVGAVALVIALLLIFIAPSFVTIGTDEVGNLQRVYGGSPMPMGQIIALNGENGPQARILPPGFYFSMFLNVLYNIEKTKLVEVGTDQYGFVTTLDGKPLRPGQVFADRWPENEFQNMTDAEYFLTNGGQKGPQLSVLTPGQYRLNTYLYRVELRPATNIPAGFVGVVKSNVQETPDYRPVPVASADALRVPLVYKGSVGIWNEPLLPMRYYLNERAYEVIQINTRAQALEYKGGFQKRTIDLTIDQEGKIVQAERLENVPVPEGAADPAVVVMVEGWRIPLELRVIIQIEPENAPFVIASVGGLKEVEDKILTPTIRSMVRNVAGDKEQTKTVLDLQDKREQIEKLTEAKLMAEGRKGGITVKEVRFGDPAIPPEFLVAVARQKLADELTNTYRREKTAQDERIQTEKSRATADRQRDLVAANINVAVETQNKESAKLRGEGREAELSAIARGQKAQVAVLGEDKVVQLEALRQVLEAAVKNPEIVKVPSIMVDGNSNGGSLEGAAAVLGGASNLAKGIGTTAPVGTTAPAPTPTPKK